MRQILITPEIAAMAQEYSDGLFADKDGRFVQPTQGLKNIIIDLQEVNNGLANKERYIMYLEAIIEDYQNLKSILPSEFATYKAKYDGILLGSPLSVSIKHRKAHLPATQIKRNNLNVSEDIFYELVVERMHYKDSRSYLGPYMRRMGVNTCVYCNIAKAAISPKRGEVYYTFDHNKPKSEYPFLCLCFYNLYPCCDNCNRHKSDDGRKGFQLYVELEPLKDPFVFEIDRELIEEEGKKAVAISFKARDMADSQFANDYNDWFRIEDLYNTEDERRSCRQLLRLIDNHRASYPDALKASVNLTVDREELFSVALGVKDDENIFTDLKKKLKLDTAKDAGLL